MRDIKDDNRENRKYLRCYLSGYHNWFKIIRLHSENNRVQCQLYKIECVLTYLGLPVKYARLFEVVSPAYLPAEFVFSLLFLIYKFIISSCHTLIVKKENIVESTQMLALNLPIMRLRQILKCYPQKEQITTVKVPFIKNEIPYKVYSMYSGLNFEDCRRALLLSIHLLIHIFKKYHRKDFLFRVYSSYEFFLSCLYVEHSDESNRFLFISTNDRWAYLFGNDTKHLNIFIQHGIMGEQIRFKAPHTAYYFNRKQKAFIEQKVFIGRPVESYFRPPLEFTSNKKLKNNGKTNLLIICCNYYLDLEKKYIPRLVVTSKYNIYVKPHPGYKDHSEYYALQNKYDIMVLDKEDYPRVDTVLSYDSALAYEYEDNGVPVLRYNDSDFNEQFQLMIEN